jgi:hypothetical protein
MANKRAVRINDIRSARRFVIKLLNERRRGEIDSDECRDVGYLLRIYIDSYKEAELEARLDQLEEAITRMGPDKP